MKVDFCSRENTKMKKAMCKSVGIGTPLSPGGGSICHSALSTLFTPPSTF